MANFNLQELNQQAFGYVAAPYPLAGLNVNNPVDTVKSIIKTFKKRGPLGNEYFMPVKINGIFLPHEPMIMVSRTKKIVRTTIAGTQRQGTIKELTSFDDYRLRIRGIITNEADFNNYPAEGVRGIKNLFAVEGSVSIECDLASILNISRIVIEDFALVGMEGTPGAEAYELSAYSDNDELYEVLNE